MKIKILKGDITKVPATITVNAANNLLAHGGGVCGAIYRAAGPKLDEYTRRIIKLNRGDKAYDTGAAVLTPAFDMENCEYIIHAVGPVYNPTLGGNVMFSMLYDAYANSLQIANRLNADAISFPAISTGIYGYPMDKALEVLNQALRYANYSGTVNLVCFSDEDYAAYKREITPWKIRLAQWKRNRR